MGCWVVASWACAGWVTPDARTPTSCSKSAHPRARCRNLANRVIVAVILMRDARLPSWSVSRSCWLRPTSERSEPCTRRSGAPMRLSRRPMPLPSRHWRRERKSVMPVRDKPAASFNGLLLARRMTCDTAVATGFGHHVRHMAFVVETLILWC